MQACDKTGWTYAQAVNMLKRFRVRRGKFLNAEQFIEHLEEEAVTRKFEQWVKHTE